MIPLPYDIQLALKLLHAFPGSVVLRVEMSNILLEEFMANCKRAETFQVGGQRNRKETDHVL